MQHIHTLIQPRTALCIPLLLGLLMACSKPAPTPDPVRAVKLVTVATQSIGAREEYAAEVRARVESRLGFRVAGKLVQRQAQVGQRVKVGDVLAQIDPQDYKLAVDAARAALTAALTNRDLAAADLARFQGLKEQNFISAAELERREAALKAAQAQVNQAQAQVASMGNQVAYANLLADNSGVVTGVDAEVGQMVAVGTPVLRLAHDGARDVVFHVPEDKIATVKLGASFEVRSWDAALPARVGKLREVSASADPLTRTYPVKLALEGGVDWPLGATVYVQRPHAQARAEQAVIKLPTSALMQSAQGDTQVWVLDAQQMTVKPVAVVVASADGNDAVIASGLKPGDRVVSAGVHVLSPGLKVTVFQDK